MIYCDGSKVSNKDRSTCEQCDDGNLSVSFCTDCVAYLCDFCQQAHKRLKIYRAHNVAPIDQVPPENVASLRSAELKCDSHPKESLNIYCKNCSSLVCSLCLVAHHLDHNLAGASSEIRESVQKEIIDLVKASQKKLDKFSGCIEYMKHVEDSTLQHTEEVKQKVRAEYASVITSLQTECKKRLNEIEQHSNKQLKLVWSEKDYTERIATCLQTSIKFAQRSLQCSDLELLRLSSQAISNLRTLSAMDWNEKSVVGVANTTLCYNRIYAVPKLGDVNVIPINNTLVVDIDSVPSTHSIGKTLRIQVRFLDPKGQPSLKFQLPKISVSVTYRKELNLPPDRISVVNIKRNVSDITVKAVCGGTHVLSISFPDSDPPLESRKHGITINGRPPTGARVTRGPDWIHRNKDGGIGHTGTVRNSYYSMCGYDNALLVDWDRGSSNHICRWGNQEFYDVQLV